MVSYIGPVVFLLGLLVIPESLHATYWMSASGNVTVTVTWAPVNISSFPENSTLEIRLTYAENARCQLPGEQLGVAVDIHETEVVINSLLPDSLYSICVSVYVDGGSTPMYPAAETIVVTPQSGSCL